MPNLSSILKSEITRLSKKVVRENIDPLRAAAAIQRKQIADLKRQIAALQKETAQLRRKGGTRDTAAAPNDDHPGQSLRFQARGLRSLRARLGLSAEDFGRLAGVSGQSIYNWETEKAVPRRSQIQNLAALRTIGKREARARLDATTGTAATKNKPTAAN